MEAESPSETCAYTLAKKKNGMNATDINPSTAVSVENPRSRKIRSRSSGFGVRISQSTNAIISSAPTTTHPQVATLLQPHTADCCSPSTISPIAPVISTVPR